MPSVQWYQTNHLFTGYCFILYLVWFYFFIPGSDNDLMFLHYGISVWLLSSQELKHHTATQEIHHGQQSFQSVLDTFKVSATLFKWPLVFNPFAKADFFLMKSRVHLPWAESLVCPWCKGPRAQQGRGRHSGGEALSVSELSNSINSSHHPEGAPGEPWLHRGAGKGSTRECSFPPAKDRRQSSPLLLAQEQEGHFPTYFPLCWLYQHGRQQAAKPQRKQICSENSHAAKNARGKQFWLGGNAWGDGGHSWFIKNHPKALWGCFMETSAARNESFSKDPCLHPCLGEISIQGTVNPS